MTSYRFFYKPVIRDDEEKALTRKVTWLELFFDLFFVVVVAQLSAHLSSHPDFQGIKEFVMLFVPTWWVWIGNTYYNERFETGGLENRLFTLLLMIPVSGMAVFARNGLLQSYTGFALSYAFARLLIVFLWLYGGYHNPVFRPVSHRYISGFALSVLLVSMSVFFSISWAKVIFGTALFIDLITPVFTLKAQTKLPRFSTSKLPERYGLFVIIVLGETIVAVISGISNRITLNIEVALSALSGIIIGFGFWWIYFDSVVQQPVKRGIWKAFSWSYLHLLLLMGIVSVGAGILRSILTTDRLLTLPEALLLAGASGFTLLVIATLQLTLQDIHNNRKRKYKDIVMKIASGIMLILSGFTQLARHTFLITAILVIILLLQIILSQCLRMGKEIVQPAS
jgi:low temperature requirement protein LtrA